MACLTYMEPVRVIRVIRVIRAIRVIRNIRVVRVLSLTHTLSLTLSSDTHSLSLSRSLSDCTQQVLPARSQRGSLLSYNEPMRNFMFPRKPLESNDEQML